MRKILVTGVNGFVGKHLVRELCGRGVAVFGIARNGPADKEIAELLSDYRFCDLSDAQQVKSLVLQDVDSIINLAGLANVGDSFADPEKYLSVNTSVFTNIADELIQQNGTARVIAVSTGAVYDSNQSMPLTEDSKLTKGGSPYAMSKIKMEEAVRRYREKGMDMIIARPFNHIGPGQTSGFLIPDLYQKLIKAQEDGNSIKVGNLQTRRDYTDVRDIACAYADLALADSVEFEIYNICSGISRSGQEILDIFLQEMGLTDKITVEVDPSYLRPNDPLELRGSYERLHQGIGWEPVIPIQQTIHDFIAASL